MSFLRKLFGGGEQEYVDKQGIYFYVQCNNCGKTVRVRADKQYDLGNEGKGYTWHKTIVDSKCFRPMNAVVTLDSKYHVVSAEIDNGRFLTEAEFKAIAQEEAEQSARKTEPTENEA